jgi:hypothetical protein
VILQVLFYGYGTEWHWCYYFSLTVQILSSILLLFSLRYPPAIWNAFPFVKAFNVVIVLSNCIEGLLPIPGFVTPKMLHLVPFQSPTWTLAYMYINVCHLPCGVPAIALARMWLCSSPSRDNGVDTVSLRHIRVAQALLGCAGAYCTDGTERAFSLLCKVFYMPSDQHVTCMAPLLTLKPFNNAPFFLPQPGLVNPNFVNPKPTLNQS